MITERLSWIAEQIGGALVGHDQLVAGVQTDSRRIAEGNLFVPLVGERYDGHDFAAAAVAGGASAFLWQRDRGVPSELRQTPHVLVDDPLRALQALARAYRQKIDPRVVAVTGSNGKTTTKDMIAAVLATKFSTYKTQGNLNNHIGLPLSLLAMPPETEVAVLEMGMNHPGEIAALCQIASPDFGVVTNIGEAHIGLLGSRFAIARAKWELIAALPVGGVAILPGDEPLLAELPLPAGVTQVTFGETSSARVRLEGYELSAELGAEITVGLDEGALTFRLPAPGKHMARNALAALAVGVALGVAGQVAADALGRLELTRMRMDVRRLGDRLVLINDAYNAAPASVAAALAVLRDLPVEARIAVLGDMLELGEFAEAFHEQVGAELRKLQISELVAVGDLAQGYIRGVKPYQGMHIYAAPDADAASDYVTDRIVHHLRYGRTCAVLLKASRKVGLELVADAILAHFPSVENH